MKEHIEQALQQFIARYEKDKNVLGIILTGSYVHGKWDKNSDLDVHIIVKNSKTRERGNTWVDNVEIEYFINPVEQIRTYFEEEKKDASQDTAHMFSHARVLLKKDASIDELLHTAKKISSLKRRAMTSEEKELAKYHLDDLEKDLEDTYLNNDRFAFLIIGNHILEKALQVFYQLKRADKEKSKRLFHDLQLHDPFFANVYADALHERDTEKKFNNLRSLIRYLERMLGGKRKKEWRLVSSCTFSTEIPQKRKMPQRGSLKKGVKRHGKKN